MRLLREIENLLERIPSDYFGGGTLLEKCHLMSHLAAQKRLSPYVEIGVYRGRSFFPLALTARSYGGKAYGIDPYTREDAFESDVDPEVKKSIDSVIREMDFDAVHREVEDLIQELGMQDVAQILRMTSGQALGFFQEQNISIGMLHVDGNHDTRFVMQDVELYMPMVEPGGIVVMDDTNWDSVKPAYARAKAHMAVLFEGATFSILINRPDGGDLQPLKDELADLHELLASRSELRRLASSLQEKASPAEVVVAPPQHPKVSVSLTTYNQERYVGIAIESVLAQVVDFPMELVIADDCSTDRTRGICREYQQKYPQRIRLIERETNLGAVPNYLETFQACAGDYVAFLEGDDFWTDPRKLQKQVEFLDTHPDFAICCHNVSVVDEHGGVKQDLLLHGVPEVSTVEDLCRGHDYISTPSCMVRNHLLKEIPRWLYALEGCDWPLDILHAEKGKIRFFKEPMAAYRIHPAGIWSKYGDMEKLQISLKLCQTLDRELAYRYVRCFQVHQQELRSHIQRLQQLNREKKAEMPSPVVVETNPVDSAALAHEYATAMEELQKLKDSQNHFKREIRSLNKAHRKLLSKYKRARRAVASAEAWQRRSWIKRALHRWREHPAERTLNLWQRIVRSLAKRWRTAGVSGGTQLGAPAPAAEPAQGAQHLLPELVVMGSHGDHCRQEASSHLSQVSGSMAAPVSRNRELDLVILDDTFPHPLSAFRFEEFCSYLEAIPRSRAYSTNASFGCFNESRSLEEVIAQMVAEKPLINGRVFKYKDDRRLNAKVAYLIFLGNLHTFLRKIEKEKIPFVFTLYPGGYFELNDRAKDKFMRKVFSSPYFRKVIVTQSITREYLLEKAFCRPEQIEYIYGVVTPRQHLTKDLRKKRHYGRDKARLDICFVAHKYSATGVDKGYDVFIEVAKRLAAWQDDIFFHVVGGFDEHVLNVEALQGRIAFYGLQNPEWFDEFYTDKDIILSPNIPFQLGGGYFDGFPTGCCTDAALHGVAMFCTDMLKLNEKFTDGQDIVIIPYDIERIVEIISGYHSRPEALMSLAQKGCESTRHFYSSENQIEPRLRILREIIQQESHAEPFHPGR